MMLNAIAAILTGLVLLPVSVFALQVFAAGRGRLAAGGCPTVAPPNSAAADTSILAVLVPAHDEALVIAATLADIQSQLRPQDRLVVVADNCEDDTATIARGLGAEVVERRDPALRGKGYALACGIDHLRAAQPPAVVVVIDADCAQGAGALETLRRRVLETQRPVQALYLMNPAADTGTRQHVSVFAWRVKNWLRPRGAHRLGWPCMLTGSGMAFPWALIESAQLAHGGIVEDMQLGLDLAMQGQAPVFDETALVTSSLAPSRPAEAAQRTRWERGHLGQILGVGPRLATSAWRARDAQQLGLLLDLLVPPLSLLAAMVLALGIVVGLLAILGLIASPLAGAALGTALLLCAAVHRAWTLCGRDLISGHRLPELLGYMVMKLPRYALMLVQRRVGWTKTRRSA